MILLACVSKASLSYLNCVTSAERAVYETEAEEDYRISSVIIGFPSCPCPLQMQPHKKLILLALHVPEVIETSTEEVIEMEVGIVLNIEQIVCVRNHCSRKKGQEEGSVGKVGKGGEPLQTVAVEKVNSLSLVKTTVGRQVTT